MKLYLISQTVNNEYDTYDSAVVAAPSAQAAKKMEPGSLECWTTPNNVTVKYLGTAKPRTKAGVILGSFNAG